MTSVGLGLAKIQFLNLEVYKKPSQKIKIEKHNVNPKEHSLFLFDLL